MRYLAAPRTPAMCGISAASAVREAIKTLRYTQKAGEL